MAEWSKALASGASPQGRGFEPHSCHLSHLFFSDGYGGDVCIATQNKEKLQQMVPRGLEPRTLRLLAVRSNQLSYETSDCNFPQLLPPQIFVLGCVVVSRSLWWSNRARCRSCIALVVVVTSCSLSWVYLARCLDCSVLVVVVVSCSLPWLHCARCPGYIALVVVVVSCSLSWLYRAHCSGCSVLVVGVVSCSLSGL